MNKKIKIICFFTLFLAIVMLSKIAYCADGSLKASQTTSGNKITVTISSSKTLGAFMVTASGMTPISGESAVDSGEFGKSSINGATTKGVTTLGKFVFDIPKKDTKVTFSASGVSDIDGNNLTISSTSITLKAKATTNNNTTTNDKTTTNKDTGSGNNTTTTTKKSTNANLSTLGVTPKEYDFSGFSKSKTSYNVTVPSNVDSLKVLYKTEHSKATVKVSGNSGFDVGSNNTIKVVVTAEDGKTTKTYTIKVTKLAEEEEKPGNVLDEEEGEEGLYLTSLSIEGIELSPEFATDIYSYTANLTSADLTQVTVNAKANKEEAKIDISGNTNLVVGENTINVVLTVDGSVEQTVYQIIVNKENTALLGTTNENQTASNSDLMGKIKSYLAIVIIVIILIIVAVIILIYLLRKENKKLQEDEEIDEDETEEYDVYKNDMNEFENNKKANENFIESLYKQRKGNYNEENTDEVDKETEEIFKEKVPSSQTIEDNTDELEAENPLEERRKRREKGRHF